MQESFKAKDTRMMEYLRLVKLTIDCFSSVRVVQVAKGQNRHTLATLASSLTKEVPRLIKVELVVESSINARVGVSLITAAKPC